MAYFRLLLLLVLFSISFVRVNAQDAYDNRMFTPEQMRQDFDQLCHTLEDTHPGLYKHTAKPVMQHKMDSLRALLNRPMSIYSFYRVIATLIGNIKCEHTSCGMYANEQFGQHLLKWKLIPVKMFFSQHKAHVVVNRTNDTSIHLGDEVLAINHQRIDSLENVLFQFTPTEGNIITSREAFLSTNMNFNFWYGMFISRPDSFDIVFRSPDGKIKERVWHDSLIFKESEMNARKNPSNNEILAMDKVSQRQAADPWRLRTAANKQYAVLTLNGFGSGNKKDQLKMAEKYAGFFAKLKQDKIPNLIIDLHLNPGGDEANAAELFSYLISEPKHFINDEYIITTDDAYLKKAGLPANVLAHKDKLLYPLRDGKYCVKEETQGELPVCQPKADRFTGKLYFYISGFTASAASTFAAVAQSNHLGEIIGQETGGTYFGGGSSIGIDMTLPNSGITTHTSINFCDFATTGDHDPNRGVIPDHPYIPTFNEVMSANNKWEEYIVKLMTLNN